MRLSTESRVTFGDKYHNLAAESRGAARTRLDPTAEDAKVPVLCLLLHCLCPLPLFLVPTSKKEKRRQGITLRHPDVVPAPKGEDSVPDTGKSSFSHLWEEDVPASPTQAIGRVHSQ